MKPYVTLFLSFFVLSFISLNAAAQEADLSSKGIGIAVKASTNGLGGDIVYNFHKRMDVRLGYEQLKYNTTFSFSEESVEYDATADYKAGSLSILFDFYPTKYIFFTVGAGYNMFHANLDGRAASGIEFGDIIIPKEKIGNFNFQIDPSLKISPYLGIGFGRTLGLKNRLAFAFEIGGYFQGSPDITVSATGLLSPTSNPDQQHEARLEKQVNQYSIYPVMKLSLSYKLFKL
jgi:hypothetical protein